jgi:hypothetical protein
MLADKQRQLAEVEAQLVLLKSQYAERMDERRTLSKRVEETSKKINRASKLMAGLAEEQVKTIIKEVIKNDIEIYLKSVNESLLRFQNE